MIDHAARVAICGAGPTGTVLALLLAQSGWPPEGIVLLDSRDDHSALADTRPLALAHGSRVLLESLDAWNDDEAAPIRHIHVSQQGAFGRTLIDHQDHGVSALGYVVPYGRVMHWLAAARARQGLRVRQPVRLADLSASATPESCVSLTLDNGTTLTAELVVHAEGSAALHAPATAPRLWRERDYGQSAITAQVRCSRPRPDTAWERFTRHGPLALLPLPSTTGDAYALVWCCTHEEARQHCALPEADFLLTLQTAFGDRLGRFQSVTARHIWPLEMRARHHPAKGREFVIGNAAQTLHPVAGQGLNLGLRDAQVLARVLIHLCPTMPTESELSECHRRYQEARRTDRALTLALTDTLPRLFSSPVWPVRMARGLGLSLLDIVPPLRHALARQMMHGWRNDHSNITCNQRSR